MAIKITIITLLLTSIFYSANSQTYASFNGGIAINKGMVASIGVGSKTNFGLTFNGEIRPLVSNSQPALFGLHTGYEYNTFEIGYAGYYVIYSTDKITEDTRKNVWSNGAYLRKYFFDKFYIEYQYNTKDFHFLTVGIREFIN
jgi:hypothetical protein